MRFRTLVAITVLTAVGEVGTGLIATRVSAQEPSQQQRPVVVPSARRDRPSVPSSDATDKKNSTVKAGDYRVPKDARIEIRLAENLSSEINKSEDHFEAILDHDLFDEQDRLVAPKGSRIVGRLPLVKESAKVSGRARMSLELLEIYINDEPYPLISNVVEFRAEGSRKKDAAKVGVGAGIGAIIGAIAGGKKGAAIGAAVGGAGGGAVVLTTDGDEIELDKERLLGFHLTRDLRIRLR